MTSEQTPVIRRATAVDTTALRALLQTYYAEIHVTHVDSDAELRAYLSHRFLGFEVAEVEGVLVACVLTRQLAGFPQGVECKRLYVLPEYRHLHLATQLMDAAEGHALAHGATYIYLDSRRDLAAALKLYKDRGYMECGRYNGNDEATVFMKKKLS